MKTFKKRNVWEIARFSFAYMESLLTLIISAILVLICIWGRECIAYNRRVARILRGRFPQAARMRIAFTRMHIVSPLQIAKSMKYTCIHKISLVCSVAKDVCQRHSTRVLTTEYINDIVKI